VSVLYNGGMIPNVRSIHRVYWRRACRLSVVVVVALLALMGVLDAQATVPHLGYGFNVDHVDWQTLQNMGFNWIKVFSPPGPLSQYVLLRIDANAGNVSNLTAFGNDVKQIAIANKGHIQAYEIGNEVNLDASFGWNAPPNPISYTSLLCTAYANIKAADPDAILVSAGLAPVGRVQTMPGNPDGSNGQIQDERQYLQQLIAAGGGACLDVVGLHPYGFSADYNATPDVYSTDPTQDCANGLCFRTAEMLYQVMQANGLGDKKVWATEFGWITAPPGDCFNDPTYGPDWQARIWQIVSADKQASNLAGAFQYADANWPWMGAMFVFNLNWNQDPKLNSCDQMRYYSVQGLPAQDVLTNMSKNIANIPGKLKTDSSLLSLMVGVNEQPITMTTAVGLNNWGWNSVLYTATVNASVAVTPTLINPTGVLSGTAYLPLNMTVSSAGYLTGVYTGLITVNWSAPGVARPTPRRVTIQLNVVQDIHRVYLPVVMLNSP
jgi:hypothetical protein